MGSRIAAHFANAGVPVVLLDLAPSSVAAGAVEALKKSKPAAFFAPESASLIKTGNFDDDLALLKDCDWIIEAVAENLEIKRALLKKISPFRRPDAIVTTNTSGLPVRQIAEPMDDEFRRHWFGAHFFNPPRYMRLLEIISTPEADPAAIQTITNFAAKRLGKTVVLANDTPNFIANRIGTFAMLNAIRVMQAMDLSIEQVDTLTGAVLGWPKMGTFRLGDLVGIDVLSSVAKNFFDRVKDERPDLVLPPFIHQMLERKWLGDKTGQGFYKKIKGPNGEEQRLGLDWKTLEYRPSERAKFPAVDMAKNAGTVPERIKLLLSGDPRKDPAAAFYWQILPELWNYSAHRIGEISGNIADIDTAMRSGFNWELGPFEMWDAAGVPETAEKMRTAGITLAPAVEELLASGRTRWYPEAQKPRAVVKKNAGASLIDLGDGVACLEFHTKMNAIGGDIVSLVMQTLQPDSEAVKNFDAFVIANDGEHFSAGANLMQMLLAIQDQEWDEIDVMIRAFQKMTQSIKFCPRPVVVAPFNLCLGGGTEVAMHGAARQAHAELYMGLVETGVGLIPAGGGCKEIALRHSPSLEKMFETVAMAKVSTSAIEARTMKFLTAADSITMNRAHLTADAKARAREMADTGYTPPQPRTDIPAAGESVLATLRMGVRMMREGEYISDHDVKIANKLAAILCGGKIAPGTPLSEQHFLDLEREAFLSLCGEKKTAERIAHTLKTGKPLRN